MANEILIPKNKTRMSTEYIVAPILLVIAAILLGIRMSMGPDNDSLLALTFVIASLMLLVIIFFIGSGAVDINHLVNSKKAIAHRSAGINLIQNALLDKYGINIPEYAAERLYYRKTNGPIVLKYTDESIDTIRMQRNGEFYNVDVTKTVVAVPLEPLKSYV